MTKFVVLVLPPLKETGTIYDLQTAISQVTIWALSFAGSLKFA